jgi:hypothetical protein
MPTMNDESRWTTYKQNALHEEKERHQFSEDKPRQATGLSTTALIISVMALILSAIALSK